MTAQDIISFVRAIFSYDYTAIIAWLKIISGIISALFVVGIAYAAYHTQRVFAKYRANAGLATAQAPLPTTEPSPKNIAQWNTILERAASDDENERKLAIIAADSLLDKIFVLQGYTGENLGARLRNIEPSDLDTLQDVWEAHKLRNRIAHEPRHALSREEAISAVKRYENTLKELRYL